MSEILTCFKFTKEEAQMTVKAKLLGFKTIAARKRAITLLRKRGFNYFVCYEDKKLRFALQFTKSNAKWVRENSKRGVWISGE